MGVFHHGIDKHLCVIYLSTENVTNVTSFTLYNQYNFEHTFLFVIFTLSYFFQFKLHF